MECRRLAVIEALDVVEDIGPGVIKANDQPTADRLTRRLEVHEKTAWMLRNLLEE